MLLRTRHQKDGLQAQMGRIKAALINETWMAHVRTYPTCERGPKKYTTVFELKGAVPIIGPEYEIKFHGESSCECFKLATGYVSFHPPPPAGARHSKNSPFRRVGSRC